MKKIAFRLMVVSLMAIMSLTMGCDQGPKKLVVFGNTEMEGFAKDFQAKTGVEVEFQLLPNEDNVAKMTPLLASGQGVPDIFWGEAAYVRQYVEGDVWEPLNKAPYNANLADLYPYSVEMATNAKGEVVALTYQVTPGGFFFRRSMARKYFGTDDPAEIGKLFATWESTLAAAEVIKKQSNGTAFMFHGIGDAFSKIFTSNRASAWIVDGKFVIDQNINNFFTTAKAIRDNGYDAKLNDWSGPFFDAMNTTPDAANVFVFPWPTWGLMFVMKDQANALGDWGVVAPPAPFTWGGSWMGISKTSKVKDLAWQFIQFVMDKTYLENYAKTSGDFVSDRTVMEKIAPTAKGLSPALGPDYNHVEFFMGQIATVTGKTIIGADQAINNLLLTQLNDYMAGTKTMDEAYAELKKAVQVAFPDVKVE